MKTRQAQELGALAMVAVALLVVGWLAVNGDQAAVGAMIGVLAAGVSFFLRSKVVPPSP